ncbi:hypothetical protein JXA84_03455 [candidate division WOR-3 bacterium]|nr:hypothetical protein [candidate division WOR-3 bacterium]
MDGGKKKILRILELEFALHPKLQPVDICKLCAQASTGVDHILEDRKKFLGELKCELEALDENSDLKSPLLQPIDPKGHIVRIHLAPLKRSGFDKGMIIKILSSQKLLRRGQDYAFRLKEIMKDVIGVNFKTIDVDMIDELFSQNTVFRHSKPYGFASYRVINNIEANEFCFLKIHMRPFF